MALVFTRNGNSWGEPIKEWTCNNLSELPLESDGLDIPNGSICILISKPEFLVYTYDNSLKEWFEL